jgi:hypothetical protein
MARQRSAPKRRTSALFGLAACALVATLATSHRAIADPANWNLLVGDAVIDTLDCPLAVALDSGRWVLLHDQWTLEHDDSAGAKLITHWKPVHHPLVHFVAGDASVRFAVAMRAIPGARTEVTVQGGLATETNLVGSPVYNLARAAGEHECRGYFDEVRLRLADLRVARADTAGGSVTAAPSQRR